ncbi:MAG: energy-coupling factor ABC transporter permease [Deltaproteobacteria bacterium]|nr:energy-coupling factor ABC transporter permease [Deltaproteobacteria bacterium]
MHMADALISPAVGGALWTATAGLTAWSAKKLNEDFDDRKVPLMGALGAFVFAAQMINFTIPATGSSGHLGGGMALAVLLGPYAAFLTMASILTIQSLFFADGGLLALGCNIFNLGFFPCFIAYPLIYKKIAGENPSAGKIFAGATLASLAGLQLGAFGVVVETVASGISDLPFSTFLLLMQPIHGAIGIVEGLVTAAVITFVWKARPEVLLLAEKSSAEGFSIKAVFVGLIAAAVITGGIFSWFASVHPDGLEWALFHASGKEEFRNPEESAHSLLAGIQEKTAVMPDYGFKNSRTVQEDATASEEQWPAVSIGTSTAGIVGGGLTLFFAGLVGFLLRLIGRSRQASPGR